MGEKILRTELFIEKGYLYYVKPDEDGYICLYKAQLSRKGRHKDKPKEEDGERKEA